MKKKIIFAVIALAAIVSAVAWFCLAGKGAGTNGESEPANQKVKKPLLTQSGAARSAVRMREQRLDVQSGVRPEEMREMRTVATNGVIGRIGGDMDDGVFRDDDGKPYPPADQALMRAAAAAVDRDDVKLARETAVKAVRSPNPKVRAAAVEALGWFGEKGLAELTPYLSDRDAEVADSAQDNWIDALQEIENDGEKAGVIELALKALADKEMAENVANELIGIDELAAVQVIVNVITDKSNPVAVEVAIDAYENVTGEKWKSVSAAEAWLSENYVPPDEE